MTRKKIKVIAFIIVLIVLATVLTVKPLGNVKIVTIPHTEWISTIHYIADEDQIMCLNIDGTIDIWRLDESPDRIRFSNELEVSRIAVSLRGNILALADMKGTVKLINLGTQEPLRSIAAPGDLVCLAISEDGNKIVSGHQSGEIIIWDTSTGNEVALMTGKGRILVATFLQSEEKVVVGTSLSRVLIWDYTANTLFETPGPPLPKAIVVGRDKIYVGGIGFIDVISAKSGKTVKQYVLDNKTATSLSLDENESRLACSWSHTGLFGWRGGMLIYDLPKDAILVNKSYWGVHATSVALADDGAKLMVGYAGKKIGNLQLLHLP